MFASRILISFLSAILRLELQPQQASQVRVWQGQRLHVLQVRPEVSSQTELRLPSQKETQDRVRQCGAVCQQWPGGVHRERQSRRQFLVTSFRCRGLLSQGGKCDSASFKLLETQYLAAIVYFK